MDVEILGDRYELQEPIGRGGMATIFRAIDLRMGRAVAVKILRDVYSADPKFVTRFQREARAASLLQHPNVVQVFDYGQSGDSYYIVMEYIQGIDLRQYLKRYGRLSVDRAVAIAHDVALGLGAAHKRGIVHRDVKPQNILLNQDEMVKLTDFGIASVYKEADAERLTTTGMTLGTVQYYAPEQAQGEIVSPAADVYALGIVLYELLVGHTPFDGDTPVAVAMKHISDLPDPPTRYNPAIPPALERIIMRCLEKDPRDRYRDGDALAYALETFERRPATRAPGATAGGRMGASGPGAGGYVAAPYAAPVATSSPARRGAPVADEETLETRPRGRAAGTLPRMPIPRQPSGPRGLPPPPDEQENGRRNGPIVAVVVSAVVLLLGVSCFLVFTLGGGLGGLLGASPTPTAAPQVITIPNFVGHTKTEAQTLAQQDNLTLTTTYQTNNDIPKDQVISQQPIAGHYTGISAKVALTLSSGPGNVSVPDVTGKPESVACSTLAAAPYYFICSSQGTMPSNLPAGEVVKTDPAAGTLEPAHSIIEYWVSPGPPTPTPAPSPTATTAPTATPTKTPTPTPTTPPSPLTITPTTETIACSAPGSTSTPLSVSVPGAASVTWAATSNNSHFTLSTTGTTTAPGTPTPVTVNWNLDPTLHPGDTVTITFTPTSPSGTPATATLTCS